MNEDGTPIEAGAAGAPEGAVIEPTADEVGKMYDELGIKAPKPTGATKGRPKASSVRAKDSGKKGAESSSSRAEKDAEDENESEDAQASNKNGGAGRKGNSNGEKTGKDSGEVREESEEAGGGVRKTESKSNGDSESGREEDSELGDEGAGQEAHESDDETEEGEDTEGKRPGKSNPAVERRMQQLANEKRAAEERAAELERQLMEKEQAVAQAKIAQEDPEYTIEDFAKVRDEDGTIIDLDPDEAELAWRRWKDGYDQRAEQRNAEMNRRMQEQRQAEAQAEQIMRSSVQAYDHLASMMEDFPELVGSSGQFDADFAAKAMPIVQKAIVYSPGTEPGNPEGNQPIIVGLRVDPKEILEAMRDIRKEKRTLPLNGLDDNIESRSNVNVPHRRSSDPTVNAANELYKELGINKRI